LNLTATVKEIYGGDLFSRKAYGTSPAETVDDAKSD
jgi:hypothetical protein